jgi:hypothetical protein
VHKLKEMKNIHRHLNIIIASCMIGTVQRGASFGVSRHLSGLACLACFRASIISPVEALMHECRRALITGYICFIPSNEQELSILIV